MYPTDDGTAQKLQVVDDAAVLLHVGMLDELGQVLLGNAYMEKRKTMISKKEKKVIVLLFILLLLFFFTVIVEVLVVVHTGWSRL